MENNTNYSRADMFTKRSGTLISTEFADIGVVNANIKIMIARSRDLIANQEERSVRFEYEYYNGYDDYPDTKIGVIDKDELEGLIKSLSIMFNEIFLTSPSNYTEVNFISRSGFKAGCFHNNKWSFYIKLTEFDSNSIVFMEKENAKLLHDILVNHKQNLIS